MGGNHRGSARVIVVGAGLAGLAAAERLGREGHQIVVVEVQERIGGRALTLEGCLANGLLAEAGPARFPPEMERVFRLARRFGLKVSPFYPRNGRVMGYLGGAVIDRYEPSAEEFWGYSALRKKYPRGLEAAAVRAAIRWRAWMRRMFGRTPWETYRIGGGASGLAQALAESVRGEIHLGTMARYVDQQNEQVSVGVISAQGSRSLDADFVVCSVPLSVLGEIDFLPELGRERMDLVARTEFSWAVRIFVQMAKPYWRARGLNGFAVTDTIGEVWDPHFDEPRSPALLVCFLQGACARRVAEMEEERRVEFAVQELEKIFPGAGVNFQAGMSFSWKSQPWIRGGWPVVGPVFGRRAAVFRRPLRRCFFAGDFAASPPWLNTVEGALESGQRVADEISAAWRKGPGVTGKEGSRA